MLVTENTSLVNLNTLRINAGTKFLVELSGIQDILNFIQSDMNSIQPKLILGDGSNILFSRNFEGCIIRPALKGIERISEDRDTVRIKAAAGENWDDFVRFCVENGYGGVENLSWIPGTVGASPVQNIGAYGMEVQTSIESVDTINLSNGRLKQYSNLQCRFSYRNSIFKTTLRNKLIITHVTFLLRKNPQYIIQYRELEKALDSYQETNLKNIRQAIIDIRKNKLPDPEILANAGSFFKNPVVDRKKLDSLNNTYPEIPHFESGDGMYKIPAAWLIEQCGLKGRREKNTGTYKKQPLVIVNYGNATGNEILMFVEKIRLIVMNHFAIRLEMEVNVI